MGLLRNTFAIAFAGLFAGCLLEPPSRGSLLENPAALLVATQTSLFTGSLRQPYGIVVDSQNNVYFTDIELNRVFKLSSSRLLTVVAGSTEAGSTDGTGTAALFYGPAGIGLDSAGNLYVADSFNHTVRKIATNGTTTTLAGTTGSHGNTDATGTSASFDGPTGIGVDSAGNVYVADTNNNTIRKITSAGVVTRFAGSSTSVQGSTNGAATTAALFWSPRGVTVDSSGNVYVSDSFNNLVRKISGTNVTTLAGKGIAASSDGTGTAAGFYLPGLITTSSSGLLYLADTSNSKIRKITSSAEVTSVVPPSTSEIFNSPAGVAVDSAGRIYVADTLNRAIKMIDTDLTVQVLAQ